MGKILQVQTAIAASFGTLLTGCIFVWPSYTLGVYKAQNGTVLSEPMTDFEASMLGSLPSLGGMLGTALVGTIINRVGRKKGGLVLTLPFILSWSIIEVSTSSLPILFARFLGGVAGGAFMVYGPMYTGCPRKPIPAKDSIRGTLASGPIAFYCAGTVCSYLMGWFMTYHMTIWLNIVISVLCAALLMTVVESPIYLMRQNREEEARAAIAQYRGLRQDSKAVYEEISRLKQQMLPAVEMTPIPDSEEAEKEKLNKDEEADSKIVEKKSPIKLLFSSPASRRAFIIVTLGLCLQMYMGQLPVQVYAKDLFSVAVPDMSSHMCSVLLALTMVAGSSAPSILVDRTGRRFLIITSTIMVAVCMIALAVLLQSPIAPAWVSAAILLIYCFFFNFGAGSIPYILLAELFLPEVQSIASMLLIELMWFMSFLLIGIFPYSVKYVGFHGMCYFFAFISIVNCITSYILIPETKGLSSQQIQEALLRRKR